MFEIRLKKSLDVLRNGSANATIDNDVGRLLTKGIAQARQARFHPEGSKLVFFGSRLGYSTHNGPCELFEFDFALPVNQTTADNDTTYVIRCIVGPVACPSSTPLSGGFPGLWSPSVSERPFLDHRHVLVTSSWGSRYAMPVSVTC